MKPWQTALVLLAVILAASLGFIKGQKHPIDGPNEPLKTKVDTLVIHDTATVCKPVYIERHKLDSVLVPALDTIRVHDTTFIYLEREQVVWRDSLSCVYASGIMPNVDSVRHFISHQIITVEKTIPITKRTHWGLGLQAGMGACKDGLTPFVGIGVSYNILSW